MENEWKAESAATERRIIDVTALLHMERFLRWRTIARE